MKKILFIIIALVSIYLLWNCYQKYQTNSMETFQHSDDYTDTFYIPNISLLINPEVIYPSLEETAKITKSNLYRTNVQYSKKQNPKIYKYLFLTKETYLWDLISLKAGRPLTIKETQGLKTFLSSIETTSNAQKGLINTFGNNYEVFVYPFDQIKQSLPAYGTYNVELPPEINIEQFLVILTETIQNQLKTNSGITSQDITPDLFEYSNTKTNIKKQDYLEYIIQIILYMILAIIFVYYIFSQTYKIGILKLHGFSTICIWYNIVGKFIINVLLFVCFSVIFAASVIACIYDSKLFLISVLTNQIFVIFILMILTIITFLIIKNIPLSQTLKKKNLKQIVLFVSLIIKLGVSIIIIIMGIVVTTNVKELYSKEETIGEWGESSDFGMFYPFYIDKDTSSEDAFLIDAQINKSLYPVLNQLGSIYINARSYETVALQNGVSGIRYISVNPNYLQLFPVYDATNNQISVEESDERFLIIVPEQYKLYENKIRIFFKEEKEWRIEIDEDVYHLEVSEELKQNKVSIIWAKQGQSVFSFNPEVYPEKGNMIEDPIIHVITEKNSLAVERESILGGGVTDPLKVKLINKDYRQTYQLLHPILKKFNLEQNLKYLVTINEIMQEEIIELKKEISRNLFLIISLFIVELLLLLQSQSIIFENKKRKYILRRILGFGFFRAYDSCFIYVISAWFLQTVGAEAVLKYIYISTSFVIIFLMSIILLIMEICMSGCILLHLEKKDKISIIKEG